MERLTQDMVYICSTLCCSHRLNENQTTHISTHSLVIKKLEIMTAKNDKWKLLQIRLNKIKSSKVFEISIITVIVVSAIAVGAPSYSLSPETIKFLAILDYFISIIFPWNPHWLSLFIEIVLF